MEGQNTSENLAPEVQEAMKRYYKDGIKQMLETEKNLQLLEVIYHMLKRN